MAAPLETIGAFPEHELEKPRRKAVAFRSISIVHRVTIEQVIDRGETGVSWIFRVGVNNHQFNSMEQNKLKNYRYKTGYYNLFFHNTGFLDHLLHAEKHSKIRGKTNSPARS